MATTRKKTTRKKAAARKPSPAQTRTSEERRFQRQNDLRVLQEADQIRGDTGRMRGAKTEAREQQRALSNITKR